MPLCAESLGTAASRISEILRHLREARGDCRPFGAWHDWRAAIGVLRRANAHVRALKYRRRLCSNHLIRLSHRTCCRRPVMRRAKYEKAAMKRRRISVQRRKYHLRRPRVIGPCTHEKAGEKW